MRLAEGIRKHGFRRWYERELLQGHAHLALTFLCAIGVFAAFEAAQRFQSMADQLIDGVAAVSCFGVGLWALRRYLYLLSHAEAVAEQADCASCGTYGRLQLLQSDASGETVQVCCRTCGHQWRIES